MKIIISIITATFFLFGHNVLAREIQGVTLEESVTVGPQHANLTLNGAGVRSKFFFKIYVGALYLPTKMSTVDAILSSSGANRVSMHFLYDEVSKEKLVDGWNDGFENNSTEEEMAALRTRLDAFNAMFRTVHENDVIQFDYIPDIGTSVYVNNEKKGTIEGADFNKALLKVWLGEEPADDDLKEGMLGLE